MSDQMNEFDQIFRDRLSDQTATPPPAVWDNIQSTRTFGHVMANKISNNWRIFGTLLMLLLAGGSSVFLFGEEENAENTYIFKALDLANEKAALKDEVKEIIQVPQSLEINLNQELEHAFNPSNPSINKVNKVDVLDRVNWPESDILASLQEAAGFGTPQVSDERLAAYIKNLKDWDKPVVKAYTHYYNMNAIQQKSFYKSTVQAKPLLVEIDYDYVRPSIERKTFKERSSFVFSITPQSIHKTLRAEYNMSSEFLENRRKAERTRLAYSASALLHYEVKNNKFIEAGINFSQIYEEVSFEGEMRFSNKYNFLEIPVLLGYGDRNAKWGWHVKGGLGVQVFNSYKGHTLKRILDFGEDEGPLTRKSNVQKLVLGTSHNVSPRQDKSELVDLENENENPYKTSGVVNLHIATGLTYFHSDKVSFLITPSYRRSINSITKQSANFNERLSYTGISFGTMVKF